MSEEALRDAVARLHELAIAVEDVGVRALAEADTGWHSSAAGLFGHGMAETAAAVRECAAQLELAAVAVRQHADRYAAAQEGLGAVPGFGARP